MGFWSCSQEMFLFSGQLTGLFSSRLLLCMCGNECVRVCVDALAHVRMCAQTNGWSWRSSSVSPHPLLFLLFNRVSLNLELANLARLPGQWALDLSVFTSAILRLQRCTMGCQDLNSGPHTCTNKCIRDWHVSQPILFSLLKVYLCLWVEAIRPIYCNFLLIKGRTLKNFTSTNSVT